MKALVILEVLILIANQLTQIEVTKGPKLGDNSWESAYIWADLIF